MNQICPIFEVHPISTYSPTMDGLVSGLGDRWYGNIVPDGWQTTWKKDSQSYHTCQSQKGPPIMVLNQVAAHFGRIYLYHLYLSILNLSPK